MPRQPTSVEKQDEDDTASVTGNDGYADGCAPASRGLSVAWDYSRAGPSASTSRPEICLRIDNVVELVGDPSQGVP
jgi:hypothetical protein